MEKFVTLLIPALVALVLVRLLLMPMKLIFKVGVHSGCGFLCLWLLNSVAGFTGAYFPINAVTVLVAGFLGLPGIGVMALLVECGLCASNSEARRLVQQGGVSINDAKVESIDASFDADSLAGEGVIIKKGKKIFHRAFMK